MHQHGVRLPCTNPICPNHLDRNSNTTGLCLVCRGALYHKLVPTCGYIPARALNSLAKHLEHTLSPTQQDRTAALRLVRGPRHCEGDWDQRPVYSAPVLQTIKPRVPVKRRLPEILIGKRHKPTVGSILASYSHFVLGQHVLGLPKDPALFLAGATYYKRRDTQRPQGQRRVFRDRVVRNSYRLTYKEFITVGRLVAVKAAGLLGAHSGYDAEITTAYLRGVEDGTFYPPVIVPNGSQPTLASGDSVFDHVIDLQCRHAPQYRRQTRRASGLMHKTGEWPALLNRSHDEVQRDLQSERHAAASRFTVKTTPEQPSTDWLFQG